MDPLKEFVSWEQVTEFIYNRIALQNDKKHFTGVYGIPRGGLCLAVMISHALECPMLLAPAPGCLIIDDICDSGESLVHYYRNSSGTRQDYTLATLYYKKNELNVVPDIYEYIKEDKWIVFPWELDRAGIGKEC